MSEDNNEVNEVNDVNEVNSQLNNQDAFTNEKMGKDDHAFVSKAAAVTRAAIPTVLTAVALIAVVKGVPMLAGRLIESGKRKLGARVKEKFRGVVEWKKR